MNKLHIGFTKDIELPKGGYLFIGDEVPSVKRAKHFNPLKHSFNPLQTLDYKKARQLAFLFYTIAPQGENTLTVRNGKRAMLEALLSKQSTRHKGKRLDRVKGDEEVNGMIADMLASPVLRHVLCTPEMQFSFNPATVILARLNRTELGEFDALVLGLFLMSHYKGQVVVPDFGFYGRDIHTDLIREGRLIAGINFLDELPPKLRHSALLIDDKTGSGTTYEDAVTLARYARLLPQTNEYNDFIKGAVE